MWVINSHSYIRCCVHALLCVCVNVSNDSNVHQLGNATKSPVFSTTLYSNANRPANRFLLCCVVSGVFGRFGNPLRLSFRNKSYKCVFHRKRAKTEKSATGFHISVLGNWWSKLLDAAIIKSGEVLRKFFTAEPNKIVSFVKRSHYAIIFSTHTCDRK